MNRLERVVDGLDPGLSVHLRALKMRLHRDVTRRLIRDMIRPAGICVDVGANRGVYTYMMSAQVGPAGHVHAVEPVLSNCERLRTVAVRRGNITVHMLAVSDHAGHGMLRMPVHQGHRIDALATLENRTRSEASYQVSLRTLDELLAGEPRISFLKCDVEGHEQRVFDGAARILNADQPVVLTELEQRHRDDPIEKTFAFFTELGYHGWFIAGEELRPLAEFDVGRDQLAFLDGRFIPYEMPRGYVCDFLFCPPRC